MRVHNFFFVRHTIIENIGLYPDDHVFKQLGNCVPLSISLTSKKQRSR